MGYSVRKLPWKKSEPKWKLQFVTYKKAIVSQAGVKEKKTWDIDKTRWADLGFTSRMTVEEAQTRAKQLNTIEKEKDRELRRLDVKKEQDKLAKDVNAYLPQTFKEEFEREYFSLIHNSHGDLVYKQGTKRSVWTKAQRIILELKIEPFYFYQRSNKFYEYFIREGASPSYAYKVIRILDDWGRFMCFKLGQSYRPIPKPRGPRLSKLRESYYSKKDFKRRDSMPLCPYELESKRDAMRRENYEALFIAVWFGLRPMELTRLKEEGNHKISTDENGQRYLEVYQHKLVSRHPEDRWKIIPVLFKEQEKAIEFIERDEFIPPVTNTIKRHFGEEVKSYGPRKGFTDLMLSLGQPLVFISNWMGHSSVERTMKSYKCKQITHYIDSRGSVCSFQRSKKVKGLTHYVST